MKLFNFSVAQFREKMEKIIDVITLRPLASIESAKKRRQTQNFDHAAQ